MAEIFVCVVHGCSLVPHTPEIFVELDIFFHIYLWRVAATYFFPLIIKAVKILFMFFHDFIRTSQLLNENVFHFYLYIWTFHISYILELK